jgi:uncharacterized membrane protein YfcA
VVLATSIALGWRIAILFIAGVAAGISNGVAGGGTFISFPTLLALGIPSLQANVSSSVGVVPSSFGGVRGFRRELTVHKKLFRELIPTCALGSITGTALLFFGSESTFRSVVPWLIGSATVLFAFAPRLVALLSKPEHHLDAHHIRRRSLFVGVFLGSVYGGYFGAGLGIILIAVLALTLPFDIFEIQGLRVALALVINTVAAVVFVIRGHLAVVAVLVLLVGALVGGWLGTLLIRRLSPRIVRALIIVIGAATTIKLAFHH